MSNSLTAIDSITTNSLSIYTPSKVDTQQLQPFTRIRSNDIASRSKILEPFQILTSAHETKIYSFPDVFNDGSPQSTVLHYYDGFKAQLSFNIEYNPNPNYGGKLILYWLPPSAKSTIDDPYWTTYAVALASPHHIIDISSGDGGRFTVPVVYSSDFIRIDEQGSMGFLVAKVFLPLVVPSTNMVILDFFITATMSDIQYMVPTTYTMASEGAIKSTGLIDKVIGSTYKKLTDTGYNVIKKAGNIETIFKAASNLLGFSCPVNIATPTIVNPTIPNHLVNSRSCYNGHVLDLSQHQANANDPDMLYGTEQMRLDNLLSIEQPLLSFNFSDADPKMKTHTLNHTFWSSDFESLGGPASYIGRHISFWRGSITYRIHFAGNSFTRTKVAITYSRTGTAPDLTFREYLVNQTFDIVGSGFYDITIPYANYTPYATPLDVLGYLHISLLTPITNDTNHSYNTKINFLVTKRFNTDIELYQPKYSGIYYYSKASLTDKTINPMQTNLLSKVENIKDLLMLPGSPTVYEVNDGTTGTSISVGDHPLSNLYILKRISQRLDMVFDTDKNVVIMAGRLNHMYTGKLIYTPHGSQNVLSLEIPRYAPTNFDFAKTALPPRVTFIKNTSAYRVTILQSVGDDTLLGWYLPPPNFTILDGNAAYTLDVTAR